MYISVSGFSIWGSDILNVNSSFSQGSLRIICTAIK
jgi:hypothetical protein